MALDSLGGLIKGLENQASWQAQRQFRLVVQHWPKAVGFAVARQTRPIAIQRSTLYVTTATAAWAQSLTYERTNILRKLNRHQRQPIKNIRFSSAQWEQTIQTQTVQTQATPSAQQHPSYVGMPTETLTASPQLNNQISNQTTEPAIAREPNTPEEAFKRWAAIIQNRQRTQTLCPQCRCYCPKGEIERWSTCALCATKRWK